jgi:hypothetical protein
VPHSTSMRGACRRGPRRRARSRTVGAWGATGGE